MGADAGRDPGGGVLAAEGAAVEFRVLGAVELWVEGGRRELGSRKEQTVLAALLLAAGRPVSADRLGECVWGEEPPLKARETLQVYISRLRKRLRDAGLDSGLLASANLNYRLDVPAECVDVNRFDRLVREADATAAQEPEVAAALLSEALGFFGGEPLAGLGGDWALTARAALLERRRAAVLRRAELGLRLGKHGQLIGELTELAARRPVDQAAVGLLMTALYNAGRLAESLAAYRETRERLNRELGAEPSRELQELHQRILRGEPVSGPAQRSSASTQAPDTLDRDPPHFTGRADELRDLLEAVREDLRVGIPSLHVIAGMPGVGKTTLALRLAHRLRDSFPDGTLQLDLRGHDPHQPPVEPGGALVALLGMLGGDGTEGGARPPDSLESSVALWRARTAGRRILLLLDDAHDDDQIRSLIPMSPGSLALVTSRTRPTRFSEARVWSLGAMEHEDAAALFRGFVGQGRIDSPEQLAEVTRRCGWLPLAITVAAGHYRSRPSWRLADLAWRLAHAWDRSDDGDELTRPVRIAFDLSYRALTNAQQQLFRRMGLHPGHQIEVHAAAMLHGASADEADRTLDVLVDQNLVEEPERHRYRMHDLVRGYAAQRAYEDDDEGARREAVRRLLDFYLHTANLAAHTLQPQDRRLDPQAHQPIADHPPVDSPAQALAWFTAEHTTMLSLVRYSLEHRWFEYAAQLPLALARFLDRQGYWGQAIEAHEYALRASYSLGDPAGQARALTDLAGAHWRLGALDAALVCAQAALEIRRERGDEAGQADALMQLGRIYWHARQPAQAEECLRACVQLRNGLGDRRGLAAAASHLGIMTGEFGSPVGAIEHFEAALRIGREIGDPVIERNCLNNLGEALQRLGRLSEAMEHYRAAVAINQEIGSPQMSAVFTHNIGVVQARSGDFEAALESFRSALSIFQEVGDVRSEIETLVSTAEPYLRSQRTSLALIQLQRALTLAERAGDPLLSSKVQHALGDAYRQQVRYPEALKAYRSALAHARRAAAPAEQARAHRRIGDVTGVTRGAGAARQHWHKALVLYAQLQLPEAQELRELLGCSETG